MASSVGLWLAEWEFSRRRSDFYEDLAEAIDDNAVLVEYLRTHQKRAKSRQDLIEPIYSLWLRRMDDRSFAQALLGTVPTSDVMILEAAERSGRLAEGLRFLAKAIRGADTMRSELRRAVAGPLFLLGMFVSMLVGFSFYLVPVLLQIMPVSSWPMVGQALYGVSQVVTGYGIWIGGVVVALSMLFVWSLPRWTGVWRNRADKYIPMYAIYRDYVGAIFLVSLASMMQAGDGLAEALAALAKRGSPWLRWHITRIRTRLDKNTDQQTAAFATGIFNQQLTDRVIDFGARQSVDKALGKVGLASIEKVTKFVSGSATVLNRLLIALCGATMIFIILGVMLTANEAQNAIQRQTFKVD